jgi:ABC-2 type transport system permease protein
MLRGLAKLTWLETKIFVREPLGVIGTVVLPVALFVVLGRVLGGDADAPGAIGADLPVFGALLIAISASLSLVAVISIYRDSGILKRLRATPLSPSTILAAHVLVKLLFTGLTLVLMILAGRHYYPVAPDVPLTSFGLALIFSTLSILAMGFVLASLVRTARFAQPIGTLIFYPLLGISGLFVPVGDLPPALGLVARVSPMTYAVSLLRGIWYGDGWSGHPGDIVMLALIAAAFTAVSARVFRWE